MFVLGLGSGQSSCTVSLRAKKYFLRSSVIYSEPCRVCDGLPPFSHTYPAADVCACVLLSLPHMYSSSCPSLLSVQRRSDD